MEGFKISEAFSRLEPEKQRRILSAAYKEFAERGVKLASTNRIVEMAQIGKGMLFYYFKSKEKLFYYLIEEGLHYVQKEFLDRLDENETDLIEKHKQAGQAKLQAYKKNPHVFNFLGTLYLNMEYPVPAKLKNKLIELKESHYQKLFKNIDSSPFRADLAPEKIIKLVQWTMDGYEKELINSLQGQNLVEIDFDPYWKDFFEYMDLLKKVYYKQEEEEER